MVTRKYKTRNIKIFVLCFLFFSMLNFASAVSHVTLSSIILSLCFAETRNIDHLAIFFRPVKNTISLNFA